MAKEGISLAVDAKAVATAGTPVVLTTREVECSAVIVAADGDNTGVMYIVDEADTSKKFPSGGLAAGDTITIPVTDPRKINIDTSVSTDSVTWLAV